MTQKEQVLEKKKESGHSFIEEQEMKKIINSLLLSRGKSLAVLNVIKVPDTFHARWMTEKKKRKKKGEGEEFSNIGSHLRY